MSHYGEQLFNFLNLILFICVIQGVYDTNRMSANAIDIAADYFWGTPTLRTLKLSCDDEILQIVCHDKCGANYECVEDTCYCSKQKPNHIEIVEGSWDDIEKLLEVYANQNSIQSYESEEIPHQLLRTTDEESESEQELTEHPALRHHIAHFCPNLEEARKCIKACMKIRKPAFCGKDHVCYCGHKYNSHNDEEPISVEDMYAKFRDLYEKYFGPQDSSNEQQI